MNKAISELLSKSTSEGSLIGETASYLRTAKSCTAALSDSLTEKTKSP